MILSVRLSFAGEDGRPKRVVEWVIENYNGG